MSHIRKPGESDIEFAKRRVYETGHLWAPNNPDGPNVKPADLAALTPQDGEIREAFRGLQQMMVNEYATEFAVQNGTTPDFDGKLDAATLKTMATPRCDVPDYAPPPGVAFLFDDPQVQEVALRMQDDFYIARAVGSGSWPKCHGIGSFHCKVIRVSMTGRPGWMTDAVFIPVLTQVQASYNAVGLRNIYIGVDGRDLLTGEDRSSEHVDTDASWEQLSGGAIGLAIVGQAIGCSQPKIWQKYDPDYQGGNTDALRIRQNTKLWMHEDGHNDGLGHNNGGGIMYPSIQNDNRITWVGDPSEPTLVGKYGGQPVVPPGGTPTPPNPPTNPGSVEARLASLEKQQFEDNIKNKVQDVKDQLFDIRLKKLETANP